MCLKLQPLNPRFLVVDVDSVSTDNHAVSRSIEYRAAWRQLQPVLIGSMVAASAGLASLLTGLGGQDSSLPSGVAAALFARRLAYWSTASLLAVLVLQRAAFHRVPDYIASSAEQTRIRATGNRLQLAVALGLFLTPAVLPASGLPLNVRDIGILATAATGLVAMHLVLKQKELAELDAEASYAAVSGSGAAMQSPALSPRGAPSEGTALVGEDNNPFGETMSNRSPWEAASNITMDPGTLG